MWECYNCGFNNVDASVICNKCRSPKPDPNQPRQGRSFYVQQQAAQERIAGEVMAHTIPAPPTRKRIREKWLEAFERKGRDAVIDELIAMELRSYATREAIRLLVNVLKNPQARGNDVQLNTVIQTLIEWEDELI
ncbi:hypothetical protein IT575_07605 [bacterium]|nr:hypothetical protein [bacterium]